MAIQQLTQPILNPIAAFDATQAQAITFVVIGGAQVIGNRLVISDNETGEEIYNKIQSTMKLEHVIPANTLTNGGYYNAVVYTIDSANNESVASTPVPFYCYSQPSLTIDNIPATETIENGTYKFVGSYLQQENELLNSYQYTLYNSNKNILSQSALIYYDTDSSLSYTFVGMSNDTAYYVELSGETINGTKITSGLKYFTVRYIQPASFAICDLVNNCEDGYIQISSNIVAIDGKSNPDPPIYIDNKEVDLRDPDSWVEWNSGFRIQDDFTMRVWGRDFNDYQNIITLTNDINTTSTPNKIELKWMIGDVIKVLPSYTTIEGNNINILNAEAAKIENLSVGGNSEQRKEDEIDFGTEEYLTINTDKSLPLQINVLGNSEQETRSGKNLFKPLNFTNNGITTTYDKDGVGTIKGTSTNTWANISANVVYSYPAGNYVLSIDEPKTFNVHLKGIYIDKEVFEFAIPAGSKTKNVKFKKEVYSMYVLISGFAAGTTLDDTIKIQLEKGSTATDFEPYGAMPSPDYPSEIKTVGSNINLYDKDKKVDNTALDLNNGLSVGFRDRATSDYITVKANTNYIFSENGEKLKVNIVEYDKNKQFIKGYTGTSFIASSNTKYIRFYFNIVDMEIIKLEEGTIATSYSSYGQGSVKLTKCNKNLFNKNTTTDGKYIDNNGSIQPEATAICSDYIEIETNEDYYISGRTNWGSIGIYDTSKTFLKRIAMTQPNGIFNITNSNCKYIRVNASIIDKDTLKIEKGSTPTPYEQHEEQSYILPTQQEMLEGDLFTQELNKKEIHHWNKIILDGTENWEYDSTYNYFRCPSYVFDKIPSTASEDIVKQLSNYFSVVENWNTFRNNTNLNGFSPVSNVGYKLIIRNTNYKTVDTFKMWLKTQYDAGIPVTIYYKLETPTSINCTEEQNTILNKLNDSESYSPQTNIYTDDIALLNAKYLGLPNLYNSSKIYSLGDIKNLINIPSFNIKYEQQYFQSTNTNFILKPNFIYTLSFDYNINEASTDLYYSIGYGTNEYDTDLKLNIQYQSLTKGRNSVSFIVPENIPNNTTLWVKFAQTIILADINVDIGNIQLESGNVSTGYEDPSLYNIYPTSASKNLFDYDSPVYLLKNNATYTPIQNGYNIKPVAINQDAYIGIGIKSILNAGDTYTVSFSQLGQFEKFGLYATEKDSENIISEISIKNNTFVAPDSIYDLQLVFEVDSSSLSNYIEIWNIQIEANNVISEYEPYVSNSAVISLDEPLRGLGEYRDLVCLESPNLLNPDTQSGIVKGDTTYYLNQAGNTQYHIWYYNEDGNLITFIDKEGHEASGITGIKGKFTTHKDCVKITITKSSNPDSKDTTADELETNQVGITKGDNAQVYYPYVAKPSVIRYIQHRVFDGVNSKFTGKHASIYTDTNGFYSFELPGKILGSNGDIKYGICNYLKYIKNVVFSQAVKSTGLWWKDSLNYGYASLPITNLNDANQWLVNLNNAKNPMVVDYVLKTPVVTSLSEDNINALKTLSTYKPISNVFTNNEILGYLKLDYVSDYTEQQTQNAYVLLKCWNANSMPYICHSNYIDIPEEKDKVFIWMRRKNNLFDLKIENLGNYNEGDKPTDKTKPIVTLEINPNTVEDTRIPVTAYSIDDNGLKTVRFSKDNGNTWDEIVSVDGLSSTNSYIFINLIPNTTYTIRVEAIDLAGNIGGISQQITTKSS